MMRDGRHGREEVKYEDQHGDGGEKQEESKRGDMYGEHYNVHVEEVRGRGREDE